MTIFFHQYTRFSNILYFVTWFIKRSSARPIFLLPTRSSPDRSSSIMRGQRKPTPTLMTRTEGNRTPPRTAAPRRVARTGPSTDRCQARPHQDINLGPDAHVAVRRHDPTSDVTRPRRWDASRPQIDWRRPPRLSYRPTVNPFAVS